MLTKAMTYWYPAANRELVVPKSAGPLVFSDADLSRMGKALMHCSPIVLTSIDVGYVQEPLAIEAGTPPTTGVRHRAFRSMQLGESYFGADASGEPHPMDPDDASGAPYTVLGHRLMLRGYVGSKDSDQWNGEVEIEWGDAAFRAALDVTRGGWIGMYAGPFDPLLRAMGHVFEVAHGKRLPEPGWVYHGGAFERPVFAPSVSEATVAWDDVQAGRVRVVITGASPAWDVQMQYHDGAAWATVHTVTVDLEVDMLLPYLCSMVAGAVVGQTQVHPGGPPISPAWPVEESWIQRISVSEFQPFVLDVAEWTVREYISKVGPWTFPPPFVPFEFPLMATDMLHMPNGSGHEPAELRVLDPDLGWCVSLSESTRLCSFGKVDTWGLFHVAGLAVPLLWCDSAWVAGPGVPFLAGIKARFAGMSSWATDRHIFGFGHVMDVPAPGANGVGVLWRSTGGLGEGELVGRMYDSVVAGWVEVIAPFNAQDWEGVPVEVCIAWTGDLGADAQRPNNQFRIVVGGQAIDEVVVANPASSPLDEVAVGSDAAALPWNAGWAGVLAAFVIHQDALSDEEARHAFSLPEEPFANPSFEVEAASGRPGEAEDWFWNSVQQVGGWAEYNAYRAGLEAWRGATEAMAAGWACECRWRYADEATRLAAVGFSAGDVGGAAYQESDDTVWILTGHAPISWHESDAGTNELWADVLEDLSPIAFTFNAGVSSFESNVEEFSIWTFAGPFTGPPWKDDWVWLAPWQDTLGPGPTGWSGWYDYLWGGHAYPLKSEQFAEAWGNDPFSTAGGEVWHPASAPNGVLRGRALSFPVTIPPDRSRLVVFRDTPAAYDLDFAAGTYATAAALAAELEARWQAAVGAASGMEFRSWTDGDDAGVEFGWDGVSVVSVMTLFGVIESSRYKDARADLGFDQFGPHGRSSDVSYPVDLLVTAPAGATPTDRLLLDAWTMVEVSALVEPRHAYLAPVVYRLQPAVFDAGVPDPSWLEEFALTGWIAPAAAWKAHYDPADLTAALFVSGLSMEQFVDTEWPDEPWI